MAMLENAMLACGSMGDMRPLIVIFLGVCAFAIFWFSLGIWTICKLVSNPKRTGLWLFLLAHIALDALFYFNMTAPQSL